MVRLVFRPYTQVRRTICTSVSLRASTRVSSGFALLRHSSPSFGSQQVCSHSNPSQKLKVGRRCTPRDGGLSPVSFLAPRGFTNPPTRTHVRLLGPCFKTGRMESPPTNTASMQVRNGPPIGRMLRSSTATTAKQRAGTRPRLCRCNGLCWFAPRAERRTNFSAVPHPTEAHRRPPSASLPAISSTL